MHRVESDNVDQDSQGRSQYKDGPPGTTINAAWLNSVQEEIATVIEGYGLGLGTKTNDARNQLWRVISAMLDKNNRAATWVFASSDSELKSQTGADQIIHTSVDAAAIIKAKAAALSVSGGGMILCMEGTYNCMSSLVWSSYVDLVGCGYRTVFRRNAAIANVIAAGAVEYCRFENFRIDGNKAVYIGVDYIGLLGKSGSYTSSYKNIISINNDDFGFRYCNKLSHCVAQGNGANGFLSSEKLDSCIVTGSGGPGFKSCAYLQNCYSYSNSPGAGFESCYYLSACNASFNSSVGFDSCLHLSFCASFVNTGNGFMNCLYLSGCRSQENKYSGFSICSFLNGCFAYLNAVSAWAFTSCFPMQQCNGGGGSAWRTCYADQSGVTAVANSAIGGYNLP